MVFVVSKIVADKTSIKKPSEARELIWARAKILVKIKISPKGDRSGLFYLTMLGTVAEDYTRVYRGKVTTQRKWKIEQINDEVQESWSTHGNG